jgi:hypothetical protein
MKPTFMCVKHVLIMLSLLCFVSVSACGGGEGSGTSPDQLPVCSSDADCDGIANESDNCPDTYNPSQTDITDENESGVPNGIGDACEYVACPDDYCSPELGECDILNYCTWDCIEELCRAGGGPTPPRESRVDTCGDAQCEPLDGECSAFGSCERDCPLESGKTFEGCKPDTWGNGVCEEWENDTYKDVPYGFSVRDCACLMTSAAGACKMDSDCAAIPDTICRPETLPNSEELDLTAYYEAILSTPCACMTCGNGKLDDGEACDASAGAGCGEGIECSPDCTCPAPPTGPICNAELWGFISPPPAPGEFDVTCYDYGLGLATEGNSGCIPGPPDTCGELRSASACQMIDDGTGNQIPTTCTAAGIFALMIGSPQNDLNAACDQMASVLMGEDPGFAVCGADNCCVPTGTSTEVVPACDAGAVVTPAGSFPCEKLGYGQCSSLVGPGVCGPSVCPFTWKPAFEGIEWRVHLTEDFADALSPLFGGHCSTISLSWGAAPIGDSNCCVPDFLAP